MPNADYILSQIRRLRLFTELERRAEQRREEDTVYQRSIDALVYLLDAFPDLSRRISTEQRNAIARGLAAAVRRAAGR